MRQHQKANRESDQPLRFAFGKLRLGDQGKERQKHTSSRWRMILAVWEMTEINCAPDTGTAFSLTPRPNVSGVTREMSSHFLSLEVY